MCNNVFLLDNAAICSGVEFRPVRLNWSSNSSTFPDTLIDTLELVNLYDNN